MDSCCVGLRPRTVGFSNVGSLACRTSPREADPVPSPSWRLVHRKERSTFGRCATTDVLSGIYVRIARTARWRRFAAVRYSRSSLTEREGRSKPLQARRLRPSRRSTLAHRDACGVLPRSSREPARETASMVGHHVLDRPRSFAPCEWRSRRIGFGLNPPSWPRQNADAASIAGSSAAERRFRCGRSAARHQLDGRRSSQALGGRSRPGCTSARAKPNRVGPCPATADGGRRTADGGRRTADGGRPDRQSDDGWVSGRRVSGS